MPVLFYASGNTVARNATHQSGVELDNPHEFLMNGAASVGLVGPLFDAKDVSDGNWDSITAKVLPCIPLVFPHPSPYCSFSLFQSHACDRDTFFCLVEHVFVYLSSLFLSLSQFQY